MLLRSLWGNRTASPSRACPPSPPPRPGCLGSRAECSSSPETPVGADRPPAPPSSGLRHLLDRHSIPNVLQPTDFLTSPHVALFAKSTVCPWGQLMVTAACVAGPQRPPRPGLVQGTPGLQREKRACAGPRDQLLDQRPDSEPGVGTQRAGPGPVLGLRPGNCWNARPCALYLSPAL